MPTPASLAEAYRWMQPAGPWDAVVARVALALDAARAEGYRACESDHADALRDATREAGLPSSGSSHGAMVRNAIKAARADERAKAMEEAAQRAERARLPRGYRWGHDAMEQFNFGKERAAKAIRAKGKR